MADGEHPPVTPPWEEEVQSKCMVVGITLVPLVLLESSPSTRNQRRATVLCRGDVDAWVPCVSDSSFPSSSLFKFLDFSQSCRIRISYF